MKRGTLKPSAILLSDVHLREEHDTPICRTDNFWEAQWKVLDQVRDLQERYDCIVLCAGDLYHYWKPSPHLLSTTKLHLPNQFNTVYGQHDLPQHSLALKHKSGIYDLEVSGFLRVLKHVSWGQKTRMSLFFPVLERKVCVWHKFVWDGKKLPWPGCEDMTSLEILKKYSQFDLIVTGDHHKPFVTEYNGRLLVNPGCLTRQHADYADHKPRVYLWYQDTNDVKEVYLDVPSGVVSREHIDVKEEKNKRVDAFLERISSEWEVSTSFEENIVRAIRKNKIKKSISNIIYKAIEYEKK